MVECSSCEKLCCKKCMSEWTKKSKTCPNCRKNFIPSETIHRFVVNSINDMMFKCKSCNEAFKFSQNISHQMECTAKTYDCPIPLCRKKNIKLKELEAHWTNECDQVKLTCSTCHYVSKRNGTIKHNCVEYLLKERSQEQAITAKQKTEIESLEILMKKQALEKERINAKQKEEIEEL